MIFFMRAAAAGTGRRYYVRPLSGVPYGTGDGSSYENAFNGFAGINQALLLPGYTLYVAGTHTETLTVTAEGAEFFPIQIESLLADPATIDSEDLRNSGIVISGKNYITVTGISFIDALVNCSLVQTTSTAIIFNDCTFSGSGNQGAQNEGTCNVTYNDCVFSGNVDDGISLHDSAIVVANSCSITGNAQGVNAINTAIFTGNDCIFSGNTTNIQPDTDSDFTLNRCFITGAVLANSNVALKFNNCRFTDSTLTIQANKSAILTECHFIGASKILSNGSVTCSRSYFKSTITRQVETAGAGSATINYSVFYLTTGTAIYAFRHNSSGALIANNCTIVGINNTGRLIESTTAQATLNNCIATDLQNGYVTTSTGSIIANYCNTFDITTLTFGSNITQNNTIVTDPQVTNPAADDFTTGNTTKNVGQNTGVSTGIGSGSWGDANTAPDVTTAEQDGAYDLGAYI